MTTTDRTGASDAEFEARIAPFEADDVRVETLMPDAATWQPERTADDRRDGAWCQLISAELPWAGQLPVPVRRPSRRDGNRHHPMRIAEPLRGLRC